MNADTTALAAAVVCPMWSVRSRVQLTSYMRPARPEDV
jgi:hypothetical protein